MCHEITVYICSYKTIIMHAKAFSPKHPKRIYR
jgi:hypothetical protein